MAILVSIFVAAAVFGSGYGGSGNGGGGGMGSGPSSSTPAQLTAYDKFNAGYALWNKGKYAEAAPYFQEAIDMKSDYAEAYNMLGFCTRMAGDLPKAISLYETALKLKPNFPEAREYYGETWLKQGNLAKAVQQYVILHKARSRSADDLLEKISEYVDQQM